MNRFPIFFGLILSGGFIGLALFAQSLAPPNTRWLGDTLQNSSDVAVYLSYIRQGAEGRIFLSNLFAVESHRVRFDPVWSVLGIPARLGLPPIVIHETARAIFILLLLWSIWAAAKSHDATRAQPRLATLLAVGGISTGWIYTIWLDLNQLWTPTTNAAPDIASEFAFGPVLMGGAHMVLSAALLITSIRLLWEGLAQSRFKPLAFGVSAAFLLLAFHPYFIPLLALISALALIKRRAAGVPFSPSEKYALLLAGLILSLPVIYYAWLLTDPVFGTHHLAANTLSLQQPLAWIITLLPFIVAVIWMGGKKKIPRSLDWTGAWVLTSVLLLIFLPVPWKRKLTEALVLPLVFLTFPAWIALAEWVRKQKPIFMRRVLAGLLILTAYFTPLHLIRSNFSWLENPDTQNYFYQPAALFKTAGRIAARQERDVLLSDDPWTNVWLPALTGRKVWVAHDHETPDFPTKHERFKSLMTATSAEDFKKNLSDTPVTLFITTSGASRKRLEPFLAPAWFSVHTEDEVTVWERNK